MYQISYITYTHPFRLRLDLVRFLAVNIMPFGIKGFTLAAGLSDLF